MATPDYALRPSSPADLEFAYALYCELMRDLTVELLPWNEASQRATVAAGIEGGAVQIVVAGEEPVGWIQVNTTADAIELGQLYIARAWQGRGIGARLVADVQERARATGKHARVSVMRNNRRAQACTSGRASWRRGATSTRCTCAGGSGRAHPRQKHVHPKPAFSRFRPDMLRACHPETGVFPGFDPTG